MPTHLSQSDFARKTTKNKALIDDINPCACAPARAGAGQTRNHVIATPDCMVSLLNRREPRADNCLRIAASQWRLMLDTRPNHGE